MESGARGGLGAQPSRCVLTSLSLCDVLGGSGLSGAPDHPLLQAQLRTRRIVIDTEEAHDGQEAPLNAFAERFVEFYCVDHVNTTRAESLFAELKGLKSSIRSLAPTAARLLLLENIRERNERTLRAEPGRQWHEELLPPEVPRPLLNFLKMFPTVV